MWEDQSGVPTSRNGLRDPVQIQQLSGREAARLRSTAGRKHEKELEELQRRGWKTARGICGGGKTVAKVVFLQLDSARVVLFGASAKTNPFVKY